MARVSGISTSCSARSLTASSSRSASSIRAGAPRRVGRGEGERVRTPASGHPMRRHVEPKAHAARPPPMIPSRQWSVVSCQSSAARVILAIMARTTRNAQLVTALLFAALPAWAAPPSTCGATDEYGKALCLYQRRSFIEAEAVFRDIADKDEKDPATIRSTYFLARTEMKLGRFDAAAARLVRIYSLDPAFYASWNCDFLLGECRRAMGKE